MKDTAPRPRAARAEAATPPTNVEDDGDGDALAACPFAETNEEDEKFENRYWADAGGRAAGGFRGGALEKNVRRAAGGAADLRAADNIADREARRKETLRVSIITKDMRGVHAPSHASHYSVLLYNRTRLTRYYIV